MNIEEEKLLIEDARNSPAAFGKLFEEYYPRISNYVLHRMTSADMAQDITSEVFFKAMTRLHTFSWRDISFSSWLYKIANNEIKMYYRKKAVKFLSLEFLFEDHFFEPPDSTDIEQDYIAAEEELSRNQQFIEVRKHLLRLPVIYREALTLRYFEGKALADIGEITGKNLNTVKSLILRGKEKLRSKMEKQYASRE
ncbi:MAG: hypothetical protein A2Z02_05225 [Chloroflexi bacterium RBG_16_48_7]|nr:MAG: hypothetical protein A2Z02_05225 [Chloroflexi bacterium RBG_16_48_7]